MVLLHFPRANVGWKQQRLCEELRPWGRSFSATMQGRLWRRIDMASLDLAVNGEACALARGQHPVMDVGDALP